MAKKVFFSILFKMSFIHFENIFRAFRKEAHREKHIMKK